MARQGNFGIKKTIKGNHPRLPFKNIKDHILGKKYNLGLIFVSEKASQKLNFKYRNKNKPTNVLAFPYNNDEGEIFINLKKADEEKENFGMSLRKFTGLLFIHALFHLKGLFHGSRMERKEKEVMKKFGI